jgi:hypothetical protein
MYQRHRSVDLQRVWTVCKLQKLHDIGTSDLDLAETMQIYTEDWDAPFSSHNSPASLELACWIATRRCG